MAVTCPRCRTENPETKPFCGDCGTPLPPSKGFRPAVTETIQTPVNELTTGSTFAGRYQVIEELGQGGMGKVYKVFDTKIQEKIALKLIRSELALDAEVLGRFSREMILARRIGHRNVCRMFDLGEAEGARFLTMEYVSGVDLKTMIRMSGSLGVGTVLSIGKQVADGLAEAHHLGIVHRDLKPGNIMIDKDGNAKIMDFGIARTSREKGITGARVMIGTPEYMSPEQAEAKEVDARADIYSLGVILYEMATGRLPFSGDTPLAVALKQITEAPQDPGKINTQLPESLCRAILKCLEKAKEKRYRSAGELRAELSRIDEEIPTAERAIPKGKDTKPKEPAGGERKINWKKTALVGGAAVLLGLVIYGGLSLFTGSHEVIDSIAVLPFENVNADPNTDFLCDGIAETIINKLSQLSNLKKVTPRNSAFFYKGKTVDEKKVGQELGVKAIVLTRLVRIGDRLTISPTLIRTRDNSQIWGERYSRKFDDIFAIEEEMATSIIRELRLKISGEDKRRLLRKPIDNVTAYEYYLKASYEMKALTESALDRGVQFLQQGIDIIGENALLYAGLAYAHYRYVDVGLRQEDHITKAEEYVKKALVLDPDIPQAHRVLGSIERDFRGNPREAIRHYKKVLAIDPNEPDTLVNLIYSYCIVGRTSAARLLAERAERIDPLNSPPHSNGAKALLFEGQFRVALEQYRGLYRSDPNKFSNQYWYSTILLYNNRLEEAIPIIDRMSKEHPTELFVKMYLLLEYALLKEQQKALELMTPDFFDWCKRDPSYSYWVAAIYAMLDHKKEALVWLENAVDRGFINYPFLAENDPFLANLRGEERFRTLMERVKYEWEHFEE